MVLRDGSYIDDLIYGGGHAVTVKVWDGHDDDSVEWRTEPLSAMPREWLSEVKTAVESALRAG
ncbi:hypothetical protein [Bradyrhizobium glycinis]|uniref:hypothetical protein n=1 Tax=Bradyrhizobium glycinis TaxID=2751812 RepID=UPI0018D7C41A|nr:hypothetical protein [Bradyrhizobium glycinis]MBH5371433.1 hypothetical protein [Bradyrhizobium glycinis]